MCGEVGRNGVALDTLSDIERMFAGLELGSIGHVFTTANCIGPIAYAWVICHCRRHDVDPATFRLQIQNDPIKEYVARGTHFLPVEAAVRLASDLIVFSQHETPNWMPISVSGSHMKQAGASPTEEAAFTIANAQAYLDEAVRKGLDMARFNPTLELHFCTEMDFFEEVAKYRAVRRAWSEIVSSRYLVPVESLAFRLHAATSGQPLTAQQPMNNIARITLQVLAQVLGGVEADADGLVGRSPRHPDRGGSGPLTTNQPDHRPRDRNRRQHRPARRVLLRRDTDRSDVRGHQDRAGPH